VLNKLQKYISDYQLLEKDDKILLTISGGADSVVLFQLFIELKINFAMAHCNFKLRKNDSDEDEKFVKKLAEFYKIELFTKSFDTKNYATQNKLSIEMAARELRYSWFYELAENYKFTKIATAHHKDDNVETILLNLCRKTGLKGLTGIQNKNEKLIRPLLFATKKDIIDYCEKNKIEFRTDKSNFETDYQRNKIRHKIIPEFEKINPAFVNNVIETAENLKQIQIFFNYKLLEFEKECITKNDKFITINIEKIKHFEPIELFLHEYLKNFGFNSATITNIIESFDKQTGKIFLSNEYKITKERKDLIITKLEKNEIQNFTITQIDKKLLLNENEFLNFSIKNNSEKISTETNFAFLDFDKLVFPLTVRHWKTGDYFYPIGMKNKKKLSDFLKDQKLSNYEKTNIWILESDNKIVWIINYRIDNRFKITDKTKTIQLIEYQIIK